MNGVAKTAQAPEAFWDTKRFELWQLCCGDGIYEWMVWSTETDEPFWFETLAAARDWLVKTKTTDARTAA